MRRPVALSYTRAPMRLVSLLVLTASLAAWADTGGPIDLSNICFDTAAKRIRYVRNFHDESGCGGQLVSADPRTLATRIEQDCGDFSSGPGWPATCQPLPYVNMEGAGGKLEVKWLGKVNAPKPRGHDSGELPHPDLAFLGCPARLTLSLGEARLGLTHELACQSPAGTIDALRLPSGALLLLLTTASGSSYLEQIPLRVWKPSARLPKLERGPGGLSFRPEIPASAIAKKLNEVGMGLYREAQYALAVEYFGHAVEALGEPAPHIAAFNQAATLSKIGKVDDALGVMAALLSFRAERVEWAKRIEKDPDFDNARKSPRYAELIDPKTCCVSLSRRQYPSGIDVTRWEEGVPHYVETRPLDGGVR